MADLLSECPNCQSTNLEDDGGGWQTCTECETSYGPTIEPESDLAIRIRKLEHDVTMLEGVCSGLRVSKDLSQASLQEQLVTLGRYEQALETIASGRADNPIDTAQSALGYTP